MPLRQLFPDLQGAVNKPAKVDIIAVHGLNPQSKKDVDHAWDTWRTPPGPSGRLWLRDDLPNHLPESRIFLYQYNATAVYGKDRDTFIGKANELLEAIRIKREDVFRPILLLGHNIGGLLIKQALINAHNNPKYMPIKDATTGLAFFATPHEGGDWKLVSLGGIAARIATTSGFQKGDDVLETLEAGSIFSDIMQEHWRHQLLKYDIISFWGALDNVVPMDSAQLGLPGDRENVVKLNADHRGVCKFGNSDIDQDNFELVQCNISDIYKNALKNKPPQATRILHQRIPFPRNKEVVDRTILADLESLLPPSRDSQSAALWGLGGSGKTQIALEFAYRRCSDPTCSVFWVHADNETAFTQDYKSIAKKLGLADTLNGEELLAAVREGIEADPYWVLVLDNADNLALFGVDRQVSNLYAFIPTGPKGTILWTSRDERIAGTLVSAPSAINVSRTTSGEATTLLETVRNRKFDDNEADDVTSLLTELDCLPLAISQAAAYMRRTTSPVKSYLSKLQQGKRRWKVLKESQFDRHRRPEVSNCILETWSISIEHIRQGSEMAYRILHFLAFVDNQHIPLEMIRRIVRYGDMRREGTNDAANIEVNSTADSDSDGDGDDDEGITNATTRLREFSFLSVRVSDNGNTAYEMHKLVQEAIRYGLGRPGKKEEEGYFSKAALQVVSDLFPAPRRELWEECDKYVIHVQRVSEWAEICEGEKEACALLTRVSSYLRDRGRWRELEALNDRVYKLRKKTLGDKHPDTIWSKAGLAATYLQLGRYDEAEKLGTEVLTLRREILADKHPNTISSKADLAMIYRELERYNTRSSATNTPIRSRAW